MGELSFRWDPTKDATNRRKHGVSFEEAASIFYDDDALLTSDPDHSEEEEERFLLLGLSARLRCLVVCHCYREHEDVIRIISARKADRAEQAAYNRRIHS